MVTFINLSSVGYSRRSIMGQRPLSIITPGPGQESVWDYPRPPAVKPDVRVVDVVFAGTLIARSNRTIRILETSHPPTFYIPPGDVRMDLLEPSHRTAACEFKGEAVYFHLRVGDRLSKNAAWSYPCPLHGYESLSGFFAFYAGGVDKCTVGGHLVNPQPGGFYGGWITPDVVGPFKGERGSMSW
jgi:uncharacterized protein (DUF427 family)